MTTTSMGTVARVNAASLDTGEIASRSAFTTEGTFHAPRHMGRCLPAAEVSKGEVKQRATILGSPEDARLMPTPSSLRPV